MKSISIVIPNYNGEQILQQNVPVILKHAQKYHAPVIIVDDKSKDKSVEIIKEKFPQVTLIEKPVNQGFSATVNLGVRSATTELVCLLNSDIVTTENFLDPLFSYFEDPQIAGVGMMDISDDNNTHGRGKFVHDHGFILHQRLTGTSNQELRSGETGWVSCGSGVFSKPIWDNLGGLDELLNPFYWEDVDYGYRAWKSGFKMYFESNAKVQHIHKVGSIKTNYQENRIKTISYRNQIYFNATNITDQAMYRDLIFNMPKNIGIALKNNDYQFLKAVVEAISNISKINESATKKKKLFRKTDHEILTQFSRE